MTFGEGTVGLAYLPEQAVGKVDTGPPGCPAVVCRQGDLERRLDILQSTKIAQAGASDADVAQAMRAYALQAELLRDREPFPADADRLFLLVREHVKARSVIQHVCCRPTNWPAADEPDRALHVLRDELPAAFVKVDVGEEQFGLSRSLTVSVRNQRVARLDRPLRPFGACHPNRPCGAQQQSRTLTVVDER